MMHDDSYLRPPQPGLDSLEAAFNNFNFGITSPKVLLRCTCFVPILRDETEFGTEIEK